MNIFFFSRYDEELDVPAAVGAGPAGDDNVAAAAPVDDDDDVLPDLPAGHSDERGEPSKKKQRKEKKTWQWRRGDLDPKERPANKLKGKNMEDCKYPVDFFMKMFGTDNLKLLLEETNIFRAKEKKTMAVVTMDELRKAIGLLMYMSVVNLPNIHLYWKKIMQMTAVSKVMTRDRFKDIISVLHLSNNELQPARGDPAYDRLYKIRPLLVNLSRHFMENAEMETVISVDEQIIPFKGNISIKFYMKAKPNKWGIKVYGMAGQTGYIHNFYICGDNLVLPDDDSVLTVSGQTVMNLVGDLEPGTEIYFDNWFASPALLLVLKERGMPAVCTLRSDRVEKCPFKSEKELKKEGRGAMDSFVSEEGIMLVKWFDSKEVFVGSNHYSAQPPSTVRRWDKVQKKYVNVQIPAAIVAYNKGMGGVDRCDQLLAFYRIKTKAKKWYKRVLYHFLDLALINSYILFKAMHEDVSMPLYEFKLDVAVSLMYGENFSSTEDIRAELRRQAAVQYANNGDPVGQEVTDYVRLDGVNHIPEDVAKVGRRCKLPGCMLRSRIWCKKCRVYLCIKKAGNCFEQFHTQ